MRSWFWTILGQPVPKARKVMIGFDGRHHGVRNPRTRSWEGEAAAVMSCSWRTAPLRELVVLEVTCVFARPKKLMAKRHTDGRLPHGVRPDGDNLLKCVGDALMRGGVLVDDGQIWRATVTKVYAARDEGPRVEVRLSTIASSAERPEREELTPSPRLRALPPVEDPHAAGRR